MNNCDFIAGPECLGTISTKNGDNVRVIEIHAMVQHSEYFGVERIDDPILSSL